MSKSKRVLWVDDNPNEVAQFVKELASGFSIEWASDLSSALQKLFDQTFDLIVLDLYLPPGNLNALPADMRRKVDKPTTARGFLLLEILRGTDFQHSFSKSVFDIPIVVLTVEERLPGNIVFFNKDAIQTDELQELLVNMTTEESGPVSHKSQR